MATMKVSLYLTLKNILKPFMQSSSIDRPVFFILLSRIFSLISAPITGILIASVFTAKLQGYYFTFISLSAVQTFVELGLTIVIIQFAAHEWSLLSLDNSGNIIGDNVAFSRLASLARFTLKWFGIAAILLFIVLYIVGNLMFTKSSDYLISWKLPWFFYCVLTSVTLLTFPIGSLLEGCNQVSNWYAFQFYQGVLVKILFWVVVLLNLNLWSLVFTSSVSLICFITFILIKYKVFFKTLIFSRLIKDKIFWFAEIWPMQWRMGLSCFCGYFLHYFFIPVLFKYHGAVVAGQMGLTWSAVGLIPSISSAWITPKIPRFAMLIAQKRYHELDKLFLRLMKIITLVSSFIALSGWVIVCGLNIMHHPFASRLLAPLPMGIFAFSQILLAISQPMAAYMRAHKQEPLLLLSIISGILIAVSNLTLGKWYSAVGMAVGYLLVMLIVVPLIFLTWIKFKNKKQRELGISC
jgi:O-antigen/teichoic acid export membrane protein